MQQSSDSPGVLVFPPLLFFTVWPLLFLLPMLALLSWGVVEREERYLEAKFGQRYLTYKANVRRWL